MRAVVAAVLLIGCGGGNDTPAVDAAPDPCAKASPINTAGMCTGDGLATNDINGTWNYTGTYLDSGHPNPMPFSRVVSFSRDGTGWCHFGVATISEHGYVDDTYAYYYDGPGGGVGTTYTVCQRTSDGMMFATHSQCMYFDTLNCVREQGTLTR